MNQMRKEKRSWWWWWWGEAKEGREEKRRCLKVRWGVEDVPPFLSLFNLLPSFPSSSLLLSLLLSHSSFTSLLLISESSISAGFTLFYLLSFFSPLFFLASYITLRSLTVARSTQVMMQGKGEKSKESRRKRERGRRKSWMGQKKKWWNERQLFLFRIIIMMIPPSLSLPFSLSLSSHSRLNFGTFSPCFTH